MRQEQACLTGQIGPQLSASKALSFQRELASRARTGHSGEVGFDMWVHPLAKYGILSPIPSGQPKAEAGQSTRELYSYEAAVNVLV